ncbi:CoA transferase [Croceicoccus sp. YJ47]|uniref:CoA transferase n=1 Tax=Croceicoccus sp. YJ47 TaxID=2798724 RepID=UPI0019247475|nr:CoA transferase [Croceicoccus sp. YJ47]QQN75292.1 CoA transferase [Croceicoccus sp. YJ47]
MENELLASLTVVDLGFGKAPALISRLMADLGARVIRVEPEGGDPFASVYPAYNYWRSGMRTAAPDELSSLLEQADVCVIGGEDHPAIPRRNDAASLSRSHPALIVLDIEPGPPGTDYAGPASELLGQVRSGLVWEQEPGKPIINTFDPASYGAALMGLSGVLAALIEREASSTGQVVSTSLFAGALAWIGTYWAELEKPTPMADYVIPRGVYPLIFRTRDDKFIHMAIGGAGSKYKFYKALEIDDPSVKPTDSGMPQPGASRKDFFGDFDLLAEHVAKKDQHEILQRIWDEGVPAEAVLQPGECWDDPQIRDNAIIRTEDDGTRRVGVPFRAERLGTAAERKGKAGKSPLEGYRVVDLGAFVAGPLTGVFLADLGADVIKVEAKQGDPNRAIFKSFSLANHGKRVIGIDMKNPEGLDLVKDLAVRADVVMNNFRPGVSERLGVDPQSLSTINPSLIAVEAPAFGKTGPRAMRAGFDMVMQAWVGHEAKAAGKGNPPRWNRTNLVDIAAGMIGSVAVLSALYHRERTGKTVSLESPLCNAGIYTLSELIRHDNGQFEGVRIPSSSLSGYHPAEALYEASDGWVAIVARGQSAALQLRAGLGLDDALGDDVAGWDEPEEKIIAGRVARCSVEELESLFEGTDVWIEETRDDREAVILSDPKLLDLGIVRVSEHEQFGRIREPGAMVRMSRSAIGNARPAPVPGQHTREILQDIGVQPGRIEALYEDKVVT